MHNTYSVCTRARIFIYLNKYEVTHNGCAVSETGLRFRKEEANIYCIPSSTQDFHVTTQAGLIYGCNFNGISGQKQNRNSEAESLLSWARSYLKVVSRKESVLARDTLQASTCIGGLWIT